MHTIKARLIDFFIIQFETEFVVHASLKMDYHYYNFSKEFTCINLKNEIHWIQWNIVDICSQDIMKVNKTF